MPSSMQGRFEGLCGNFNGDSTDDFTTSDGLLTDNHVTFAKSFGASAHCKSVDVDVAEIENPCEVRVCNYPGRHRMLLLQDLARFLQKDVNLSKSCNTMLILQHLARRC